VELKPGGRIEGKTTVQAQHVIKDMKAKPGGGWEPYVRCRHKVTRVYAWSGAVSAVNQNEGTFSAGELTYTITQDTEEIPEKPAWSCRLTPAQLHWTSSPWGGGAASVRTWRYVLGGDVNRTGREIRLNAPLAPYPLNTREEYLKAD